MTQYTIRVFRPYPLSGRFYHATQLVDVTEGEGEAVALTYYFLGRFRGEFAHLLRGVVRPDAEGEIIGEAFAPEDIAAEDRRNEDRLEKSRLKRVLKDPKLREMEADPQQKEWAENYRAGVMEKIKGAR